MIITTKKEFDKLLNSLFGDKPKKVRIATYGYRDVPDIQERLDSIKDTKLLVGLSPLRECATNCINCRVLHNLKMTKYHQVKNIMKDKIGFRDAMHTKIYYFEFPKKKVAILGSRNLTGSDWSEINVVIEDEVSISQIVTEFDNLWDSRTELRTDEILDYEKIITNIKKYRKENGFLDNVYTFYKNTGIMTEKQITCCIRAIDKMEDREINYDLASKRNSKLGFEHENLMDKF